LNLKINDLNRINLIKKNKETIINKLYHSRDKYKLIPILKVHIESWYNRINV